MLGAQKYKMRGGRGSHVPWPSRDDFDEGHLVLSVSHERLLLTQFNTANVSTRLALALVLAFGDLVQLFSKGWRVSVGEPLRRLNEKVRLVLVHMNHAAVSILSDTIDPEDSSRTFLRTREVLPPFADVIIDLDLLHGDVVHSRIYGGRCRS